MIYEFEWDPEKARANQHKHGVPFEEAATVFLDPRAVSLYDEEHSEQEDRWITLGFASTGRILVVIPHIPANRRGTVSSTDHYESESHKAGEGTVWLVRR